GEAAAAKAEPVAAGRTDEPSRPGIAQLAGGVFRPVSVCVCADLTRSLLSRCNGEADRGDLEQGRSLLSGKLRAVRKAQDGAPRTAGGCIQEPARADRAPGSIHQPFSSASDEGEAGAEQDQGTGEDRAD